MESTMHIARFGVLVFLASCTTEAPGADDARTRDDVTRGETTQAISPFVGFCAQALSERWQNQAIAQRTSGVVNIQFTANVFDPEGAPVDAVLGFSDLPAEGFADLGPIVRFNPDGMIDARNGDKYAADIAVPYIVNTSFDTTIVYTFRMVIDLDANRYSVFVREVNGPERQLASNYAFRTEQAGLQRLGNVGMFMDSPHGAVVFCNGKVTPPLCRSSNETSGWATAATYPELDSSYIVEVDVVPLGSNIDAIVGLASDSPSTYGDLAAILRFNADGLVDARDGDTYRAFQRVPYVANRSYTFVYIVDLARGTYSAWLDDPGAVNSFIIANNHAFRTEQAGVTSLGTIGQKADIGSVLTCDVAVSPL
jgi:hypothetical protein